MLLLLKLQVLFCFITKTFNLVVESGLVCGQWSVVKVVDLHAYACYISRTLHACRYFDNQ